MFENAAVAAGFAAAPAAYHASWFRFDNTTGETQPIAQMQSTTTETILTPGLLPTAPGTFIEVDLTADSADHPTWQQPVRTFFRRTSGGWTLVGLERLPDGKAGAPVPPQASKEQR